MFGWMEIKSMGDAVGCISQAFPQRHIAGKPGNVPKRHKIRRGRISADFATRAEPIRGSKMLSEAQPQPRGRWQPPDAALTAAENLRNWQFEQHSPGGFQRFAPVGARPPIAAVGARPPIAEKAPEPALCQRGWTCSKLEQSARGTIG